MHEKRKYERSDLKLPGKIEMVTPGKPEVLGAVTRDISAGGAFFHPAEPVPKGERVKLIMILSSEKLKELTQAECLIKVGGTVVRSGPKGMAIGFDENYQVMPLKYEHNSSGGHFDS